MNRNRSLKLLFFSFVDAGIKQDFQMYLGGLEPRQIQQLMKIMFDIRQVSTKFHSWRHKLFRRHRPQVR